MHYFKSYGTCISMFTLLPMYLLTNLGTVEELATAATPKQLFVAIFLLKITGYALEML